MDSAAKQVKRVLFISGNYYPEAIGIGKFNGEMIDMMASRGYHCTVITAYPYYPYWKIQAPYTKWSYWFKKEKRQVAVPAANRIDIYRCPLYVPGVPTGTRRMLSDFSFCCSSFIKLCQLIFRRKYDYVITVAPCFLLGLLGVFYKKLKGVKLLYHIQDLQIDAAQEMGMIKSRIIINSLLRIEKFILKNSDVVSSISTGMIKKINRKCSKEVVLFPNWVETDLFYPMKGRGILKRDYGFSSSDYVVLYSGAIGEKQGLEDIIGAAKELRNISNLKFVICGSGPYKEKLQALADELCLENILFLPLQPQSRLNSFLNMADVHLVLQKANASDLVMPSKLTAIFSVGGLAIVATSVQSSLHELITTHQVGIAIAPENQDLLIKAIKDTLINRYEHLRTNARKYAEAHLAVDNTFPGYLKYLQ